MRSPKTELAQHVKPTATESVRFRDGMLVTADDLDAAMRYPETLLHTVLRAYFGRGVVCGLELSVEEEETGQLRWDVCVSRGVAIDCDGHPIELCGPVRLDLSPDRCATDVIPEEICIAIRRLTSDEVPRDACSCDVEDGHRQCTRVRDHVIVKAFNRAHFKELHDEPAKAQDQEEEAGTKPAKAHTGPEKPAVDPFAGLCGCHATCPPRDCGDDCWIVLGCLQVDEKRGFAKQPDLQHRHRVRPTQCLCALAPTLSSLAERVGALEQQMKPAPQS